jgi:light-regulated signal transduction histidine kinase (bacteriophytochrome)
VGTRGVPFSDVNMEAAFEEVIGNLMVAIQESNATITHDPLPTIRADPTQMRQVLQNLIGNAIKFHAERKPAVHVSARRDQDRWVFWVRDNGIGIEADLIDKLFVIFQRLHSPDKYPGTGIGLAVAKKIIVRHGGNIWVESVPGQGSTFYFSVPIKESSAVRPDA